MNLEQIFSAPISREGTLATAAVPADPAPVRTRAQIMGPVPAPETRGAAVINGQLQLPNLTTRGPTSADLLTAPYLSCGPQLAQKLLSAELFKRGGAGVRLIRQVSDVPVSRGRRVVLLSACCGAGIGGILRIPARRFLPRPKLLTGVD